MSFQILKFWASSLPILCALLWSFLHQLCEVKSATALMSLTCADMRASPVQSWKGKGQHILESGQSAVGPRIFSELCKRHRSWSHGRQWALTESWTWLCRSWVRQVKQNGRPAACYCWERPKREAWAETIWRHIKNSMIKFMKKWRLCKSFTDGCQSKTKQSFLSFAISLTACFNEAPT